MKHDMLKVCVRLPLCCAASLILAAACVSCSIFDSEPEKEEEIPDLTAEQISSMTSDEVQAYYAKKNELKMRKRNATREKRSSKWYYNLNSVEKRERLRDVGRQLPDDSENAVYPWRSSSTRSDELDRSQKSVIYDW